jgi:hypothetical protein
MYNYFVRLWGRFSGEAGKNTKIFSRHLGWDLKTELPNTKDEW